MGFNADAKENLSLDEVEQFTAEGHPTIALAQVWRSHKHSARAASEEWNSGHYIVALKVDKDCVYFVDPYVGMSKALMQRKTGAREDGK